MIRQNYSTCKGCHAQVLWTQAANGSWMICNPEVILFTPGGGTETFVTPEGKVVRGKRSAEGQVGYISHWATCPNRDQFKKEKKK